MKTKLKRWTKVALASALPGSYGTLFCPHCGHSSAVLTPDQLNNLVPIKLVPKPRQSPKRGKSKK